MSERVWTQSQQKAIDHSGTDLIVAAAAGSGKTATLTERVIRRVADGQCDLSRMLIVTFTKAAAEELRVRIRKELSKRSALDPRDKTLKVKLLMLNSAQISTIDGFCSSLVKEHYTVLGLPAGMRIAEDAEAILLKKRVMEKVIDEYFENTVADEYKSEYFSLAADSLIKGKTTEKLSDVLISIYNTVNSSADGAEIIRKTSENLLSVAKEGFFNSIYKERLKKNLFQSLDHFIIQYEGVINKNISDDTFFAKYNPLLADELSMLNGAKAVLQSGNTEKALRIISEYQFSKLYPVKGEFEWKAETKKVRDGLKEEVKAIAVYDSFSDEQLKKIAESGSGVFDCIYKLIKYFDLQFGKEKIYRKIMDYSDLEHYAYRLLYNPDGSLTDLAISMRDSYDEIYVDEYQDCNSLQDRIFASISKNNRFLVGDIKQSIYGFRGAEPDLFAEYRKKYESTDEGTALFLSNNFRCSENIISFSNLIFSSIFSKNASVPYTKDDELVFSKSDDSGGKVTVAVIEGNEDTPSEIAEAEYVAATIEHMIDNELNEKNEKYTAGDFAILLRSAKKSSSCFEDALKKRGIPVYNGAEKNFFESSEVLLAVCLLSVIDNPMRDIQLAGLMQSPLYGFTLDDMIRIRKGRKEVPLFVSLTEYAKETNDERCKFFLDKLALYRKKAQGMQTDKLVWYLYNDTGIFTTLCSIGRKSQIDSRRENLMTLYEYARKFESGSFKGLYNFINYINEIIERKTKLETVKSESDEETSVKIMTVHKSKGLEYPVCFLADSNSTFSTGNKTPYKYDKKYGFGIKFRDESGFAMYKTPMYQAVNEEEHEKNIEEEGRILYVALTRARHRLFVTCQTKDAEKLLSDCLSDTPVTEYGLYNSKSYMEMILRSLNGKTEGDSYTLSVIKNAKTTGATNEEQIKDDQLFDEESYNTVKNNLAYEYPYAIHTVLPKKVAVSKLHPDLLDESDEGVLSLSEIPVTFEDPEVIRKTNKAAKKGIATHLFMQFCDFQSVVLNGAENEAQRLLYEGFLLPDAVEDIDFSAVESFFKSSLFAEISNAYANGRTVKREYRFNINLAAKLFTENPETAVLLKDEKILVQGVVDIFYENENGSITIADYKTDYIKNTPADIEAFKRKHKNQISYYKVAIERITGKPVEKITLYSFCLNKEISV